MTERYRGPYVGVSGVGLPEHQTTICDSDARRRLNARGYQVLLGAKAMDKAQVDEVPMRKSPEWYPVGDDLRSALDPNTNALTVLQLYCSDWNDEERTALLLSRSVARARSWLDGLQFDKLPWAYSEIHRLQVRNAARLVGGPIILQCYDVTMQEKTPAEVVEALRSLEDVVTHVLFDASEGNGKEMDSNALSSWIDEVKSSDLSIGVGVAGGMDAVTVETHLPKLLERHGELSWDAEGRLHTADYRLNMAQVDSFLASSAEVVEAYTRNK